MTRRRDFLAQGAESSALDDNALFQYDQAEATGPAEEPAESADQTELQEPHDGGEDWHQDAPETVDATTLAAPAAHRARHADAEQQEQEPGPMASRPLLALALGAVLLLGGLGLAAAAAVTPASVQGVLDLLNRAGAPPALLMLGGLVLVAVGTLARRMHQADQRIDQLATLADDASAQQYELGGSVQKLLEELGSTDDSIESGGLHRIIHILHRLDEKTNNLTRAFKMYGKPLIDIAKQVTQVEVAVRETHEAVGGQAQHWTALQSGLREIRAAQDASAGQQIERLDSHDTHLRELAARSGDPRIAALAEQLQALGGSLGQVLERGFDKIEQGLDERTRAVTAGVDRVLEQVSRPAADAGAGEALHGIRQDLAGLAQQLKAIASARPAAAPTPARASEPGNRPAAAPAAEPKPEGSAPGGLAQSIAGTKSSPNKNVMSAIEKLKSLRK